VLARNLALGFLITAIAAAQSAAAPLWTGSRYTVAQRDRAVQRGLEFIYKTSLDPDTFSDWGHDLLWCFYTISATAQNPQLRQSARTMGGERAKEWRRIHPTVPGDAGADDIADLVFGSDAAQRLGVPDAGMKEQLRRAAAHFSAVDFLRFDAAREPPSDILEPCEKCESPKIQSRYDIWLDALVTTYTGDRYGIKLGASYRDVIRWVTVMRPYPPRAELSNSAFLNVVYAITHVVYTLNAYGMYRLSPEWLPAEYQYLRDHLTDVVNLEDPETTGEFLDTLRAFGLTEADPLIRQGVEYLLSQQNADGSWGDVNDKHVYDRYHSTWTVVDGLRQYRWHGQRISFPHLQGVLDSGKPADSLPR
jgi:hypothetical protein